MGSPIVLSPDEDAFIYDALLRIAAAAAIPRLAITSHINDIEITGRLGCTEPAQIVRRAMNLCLADAYRLSPPALIRLLRIALILDPRIDVVIARLNAGAGENAVVPDPFTDSVLAWKAPFLERRGLREALKSLLIARPNSPFVVVNGDRRKGKSYTAEFISHVLQDQPEISTCLVTVREKQGAAVGPSELARDLVARMGGSLATEPPKVTNLDRWYEELVSWVTEAGFRAELVWWIVLDGFNADELRPDTRTFIAQLAARLTGGLPQRRFRLILLDFDRTWLPVLPGKITLDTTGDITAQHVSEFIDQIFAGSVHAVDTEKIATDVLEGLGNPVNDLSILNQRLTDLIEVAEVGQ